MYDLMVFSIFTELCNHSQSILEHFYHSQEKILCSLAVTPCFSLPLALGNHQSAFCLLGLPTLDISYKENHM